MYYLVLIWSFLKDDLDPLGPKILTSRRPYN